MANEEHAGRLLDEGVEAWNAWREVEPDVRPDLSHAALIGTALIGANFSNANLNGTNLSRTSLSDADLRQANLYHVNLSNVNLSNGSLRYANLRYADLSNAHLGNAHLGDAHFSNVNLSNANLNGAKLSNTVFAIVDLSDVNGLETCIHHRPSSLDNFTLSSSHGLPLEFLRGCGLSDWQIEAAKLNQPGLSDYEFTTIAYEMINIRSANPIGYYSCFISYSHADKAFARRLHDTLQERGIRCWLDERQLLPGDNIYDQVDRGIRLWDKVLLCCSEASLTSWWVDNEINKAFTKEQQLWMERKEKALALIPLDLDGYLLEWEDGKADAVRGRLTADFRDWEENEAKVQAEIEKVVKALRADGGGRETPPVPKL